VKYTHGMSPTLEKHKSHKKWMRINIPEEVITLQEAEKAPIQNAQDAAFMIQRAYRNYRYRELFARFKERKDEVKGHQG